MEKIKTKIVAQVANSLSLVCAGSLAIGYLLAGSITPAAAQLTGSISGTKFNDLNQNGIRDPLEPALAGWEIELIDFDGDVIGASTTNELGLYEFTNLSAGPYVVREVLRPGWEQTLPTFVRRLELGEVTGEWNYDDPDATWPLIAPDAGGNFQSPVNITGTPPINLGQFLDINYSGEGTTNIRNTGHTFNVEYVPESGNYVNVAGERFNLAQFHFHYESEHALNNILSDMELHFVNRHEEGGLSVLGLLIEEGETNQALAPLFDAINSQLIANGGLPQNLPFTQTLDLSSLFPENLSGWFYNGSLTTPPATEGVNWFVFEDPIELSAQQIGIFRDYLESVDLTSNNRPLQPLNGRQFNQLNYQVTVGEEAISNLNFGNTTVSVPEPSSIFTMLFLGSLGGASALKRKRQSHDGN